MESPAAIIEYIRAADTTTPLFTLNSSHSKPEVFMYLNIGNDMAVRESSVIGIFDLDNTSTSKRTRAFLEAAEREGQVVPCDDLPKSFVLTAEYGLNRVFLTSLSSTTLEKRMK